MNKPSQFSFNRSSLISLQAELARKREEAANVSKNVPQNSTKLQIKPHIQQEISCRKEVKKEPKKSNEPEEVFESELVINDKVKEALIVKTKLYEQLRNKELICEDGDRFLVNFDKKSNEASNKNREIQMNLDEPTKIVQETLKEESEDDSDSESEWVTFVDALGRSRTCLRTDLDYYKNLDSKLVVEERKEEQQTAETLAVPITDEMLLWDKRKEELRKMWEEEEAKLLRKANIHYQDVLFNEARTHGVGYYSFSQDENERVAQQEALKKLREETEKNQKVALGVKDRRNQLMKQRIAAAKRRKRLEMGLPPSAEDEEEPSFLDDEDPNPKKILKQRDSGPLEQKVDEFLNVMKRSAHVRPWDVGKDGVQAPVLTQHEWNEKQRAKRLDEFAPPSTYNNSSCQKEESNFSQVAYKKCKFEKSPINFEDVDDGKKFSSPKICKKTEIPPPLFYDKVPDKKFKKFNIKESIEAGLNFAKNEQPKKLRTLDDRIRDDYK